MFVCVCVGGGGYFGSVLLPQHDHSNPKAIGEGRMVMQVR